MTIPMSARDEILSRVREALAAADRGPVAVPRHYRTRQHAGDVVGLFCARVADYRATVVRCPSEGLSDAVAAALGTARAVVPDGLPFQVPGAVSDSGLSAADLDGLDAVVTTATVGIAETGTIVLTHGAGQGRRALTLVPDLHVCVVRADQVVRGVPDAVAVLDPGLPQTWISGPSATSDIELSRVEGVHGPRNLVVVVTADEVPVRDDR